MHPSSPETVILGLNPVMFASILFILTYLAIMSERLNRAIVALLAAGIMILSGVLNQKTAIQGIDFNTIGLLTGMMIIVTITRKCGIFEFLAIWSAKKVNAQPWGILVVLVLVTAILSALLDNVTTVLLIVPVTLLITDTLKVSSYPYLFAEIFASNVGGTATLIGDPPNIMIGSAANLSFNAFLYNLAPLSFILLLIMLLPIYLLWGRKLTTSRELRMKVMQYSEKDAITDTRLLKQSLGVLALVMIGFIFSHHINQQPATIAMAGAALLLMLDNLPRSSEDQSHQVHKTFSEIEWTTIFFFIGLFIAVHGLEQAGVLEIIAHGLLEMTHNEVKVATFSILWVSAIASALVDNIPFVATMIPLIKSMGPSLGGEQALEPVWWALAIGSCLGGNGSLVGASANLIVAGFAERSGQPIKFLPFMLLAFPMMLFSIMVSTIYVYFRYF